MRKKKAAKKVVIRTDTSNKARKVAKRKKKRVVVPKTRGAGTYTESEYFSRIRSSLRRAFRWWPPMMLALKKASRPSQSDNKRLKTEYQCAMCKKWKARKDVEIDHIEECGSLSKYEDVVPFIKRLTKENVEDYQILCKNTCHKDKTKQYLINKKNKK